MKLAAMSEIISRLVDGLASHHGIPVLVLSNSSETDIEPYISFLGDTPDTLLEARTLSSRNIIPGPMDPPPVLH